MQDFRGSYVTALKCVCGTFNPQTRSLKPSMTCILLYTLAICCKCLWIHTYKEALLLLPLQAAIASIWSRFSVMFQMLSPLTTPDKDSCISKPPPTSSCIKMEKCWIIFKSKISFLGMVKSTACSRHRKTQWLKFTIDIEQLNNVVVDRLHFSTGGRQQATRFQQVNGQRYRCCRNHKLLYFSSCPILVVHYCTQLAICFQE